MYEVYLAVLLVSVNLSSGRLMQSK